MAFSAGPLLATLFPEIKTTRPRGGHLSGEIVESKNSAQYHETDGQHKIKSNSEINSYPMCFQLEECFTTLMVERAKHDSNDNK
jgi:hypothetical protein